MQARPEGERLHAPRLRGRVQEQQQRARVRGHRARHVAEDDELAWDDLPRPGRKLDELPSRTERPADDPADVEPLPARGRPEAPRRPARADAADLREQTRDLFQLGVVEEREVLSAQNLDDRGAARTCLSLVVVAPAAVVAAGAPRGSRREHLHALLVERVDPGAANPGCERTVEELELVAVRHESLTKGEVDVPIVVQADRVQTADCVGDAARADLGAAASVFPTPASPSRSTGFSSAVARKSAVASPRSGR